MSVVLLPAAGCDQPSRRVHPLPCIGYAPDTAPGYGIGDLQIELDRGRVTAGPQLR